MRSDNVVVATGPFHRRTVMGGGGDAVAVLFNGEPWLPEYNLALAVGSEPRIVPGIRAVDARQSAPHPRGCVSPPTALSASAFPTKREVDS